MQATIDGPLISQGWLEAPATQAQIYAYTNADTLASTSNVVAGYLSLTQHEAYVLFDSGFVHSFVSHELTKKTTSNINRIHKVFRMTLSSREVWLSKYCRRQVLITIIIRNYE